MSAHAKILLVEDGVDEALVIRDVLASRGFEVEWVATSTEGAERLATHAFSVVLTDYLTGHVADAAQDAGRLLDAAGAIPVVCTSAWHFAAGELVDRFASVLYKPFAADELLAVVGTLMSLEKRPHETAQVHRYFHCLSRRDWEALGALCTEDVEYRVPQESSGACQVVVGRAAFVNAARETFSAFPDAEFEVTDVATLPKGAVARYIGRWTLPSHEVATLEAAVTFGFSAGQISTIGVRLDARQLQVLTDHPGRAD